MCCEDDVIFLLFSFFGNNIIVSINTITTSIINVTITMTNTILIIGMKVEHTMAEKRVLESSAHPFIISLRCFSFSVYAKKDCLDCLEGGQ